MITTINELTALTEEIQQIITTEIVTQGGQLELIGYYFETNDLTGDDLPQITHQTLEQFKNEKSTGFELTHLRLVNRISLDESQKVLTLYLNHKEQTIINGSIKDKATANFKFPDERSAFIVQLNMLISNAFDI